MKTLRISNYDELINDYLKSIVKLRNHDVSQTHLQIRIPGSSYSSDIVITRLTTLLKKRSAAK